MADQNNTNEFERLSTLQAEAVAEYNAQMEAYHARQLTAMLEYEALSEDYWRKHKLITMLRRLGWAALTIAAIVGIAYIWLGVTALGIVELVCNVCWVGFTIIADDIELSTLRPWRIAMIKYIGWDRTDD